MLQAANSSSLSVERSTDNRFVPQLDALGLLRIIYRHWPVIAASVGICFLLGIVYLFVAQPKYTASFLIYIDPRQSQTFGKQEISMNGPPDPGIIESQVEILKSESVALTANRLLKERAKSAGDDVDKGPGFFEWVREHLPFGLAGMPPTEDEIAHAAAESLSSRIKAKRVGNTYVIEVNFSDGSPDGAAKSAQAIADAYVENEMNAKLQATQKATNWMRERITELREQASNADRKTQRYKAENNIVDIGRGYMLEQQLADLSSQMAQARVSTEEAKARLDRVNEVSRGDVVNGSVADALRSDIITRLRSQYLDLQSRQSEFTAKYGASHSAVQNIIEQKQQIKLAIQAELSRINESSKSDYEIALSRERAIQDRLAKLVQEQLLSSEKQVELRDLEGAAQSYRNIYDTFFQQFELAVKEQNFPVVNARIITTPFPPDRPSWPKPLLVLPLSIFMGVIVGFFGALVREFLGNGFRLGDDVINYAGFECLGILPNLALETTKRRLAPAARGLLGGHNAFARHSINAPFSRFTETLRNVKVTINSNRTKGGAVVVGVVSSVPKEGKTTFSANMAQLVAKMGHRTLVIDGDFHNPSLTRTLAPKASVGAIEVLQGRISWPMLSCTIPKAV